MDKVKFIKVTRRAFNNNKILAYLRPELIVLMFEHKDGSWIYYNDGLDNCKPSSYEVVESPQEICKMIEELWQE